MPTTWTCSAGPLVLLVSLFGLFVYQPYLFIPSSHPTHSSNPAFPVSSIDSTFLSLTRPHSNHSVPSMAQPIKKTACVIFSHGLGDTSIGWSFLAEQCAETMPWIKWILPDAPVQPVTLNGGMQMPSWFDIVALEPTAPEDEKGLLASVDLIGKYIQREVDNGMPPERIIVGGFSQGATIGILSGLTSPHKLAGVISLSGFVPLVDKLKSMKTAHSEQLPVFWGHGTEDSMVRYDWGQESVEFLVKKLGMKRVDFKTYTGLGHNASPKELKDMTTWITTRLPS